MTVPIGGIILDACVLAILQHGDTYGYELTQNLQKQADISESTLYPVLRRLQKDNCLETYDLPHAGRNRRYYKITELGRNRLSTTRTNWEIYKNKVDTLMSEPKENEKTEIIDQLLLPKNSNKIIIEGDI